MRKNPLPERNTEAAAAELAIKAHVLASNPEIMADIPEGESNLRELTDTVNLREAPEDAICSLVIDLMRYCERKEIDWLTDVMSRAQKQVQRA